MIQELATQTANWLAATGAPNGVVLLFILTNPALWSETARDTLGKALDRVGLGGAPEAAESGSQDQH